MSAHGIGPRYGPIICRRGWHYFHTLATDAVSTHGFGPRCSPIIWRRYLHHVQTLATDAVGNHGKDLRSGTMNEICCRQNHMTFCVSVAKCIIVESLSRTPKMPLSKHCVTFPTITNSCLYIIVHARASVWLTYVSSPDIIFVSLSVHDCQIRLWTSMARPVCWDACFAQFAEQCSRSSRTAASAAVRSISPIDALCIHGVGPQSGPNTWANATHIINKFLQRTRSRLGPQADP